MGNKLSTARDLRSALLPWTLLSFVLAIVAYVFGQQATVKWHAEALEAVASSLLSVAVALLITEYVLKPLYVRDLLDVAQLSAQVHDAGVVNLQRFTGQDLDRYLGNTAEIDISGHVEMAERAWPTVLAAAKARRIKVFLHLQIDSADSSWRIFERKWKDSGCNRSGSSLSIFPADAGMPMLSIMTDSHCIVAIADGPIAASNPLLVTFLRSRSDAYVTSLTRFLKDARESDAVPFYESKVGE